MNVPFRTGFVPIRMKGGVAYNGGTAVYPVKNNFQKALYAGTPVMVSAGYLDVCSNTRSTAEDTFHTNRPVGVVESFAWVDETTRTVRRQSFLPANTSAVGAVEDYALNVPIAYVHTNPDIVYAIKADLSIPLSQNGKLVRVTNAGGGSTVTGRSAAEVDGVFTNASVGNCMAKVVGVHNIQTYSSSGVLKNNWDTAQTIVEVVLVPHALS